MRIVGGEFRGRVIAGPGAGQAAGDRLRPTPDRVRESLFNRLEHAFGDPVTDAVVLDLFAGTGALGLEALSRGARAATFVERTRAGAALIRRNVAALGLSDRAAVLQRDATRPGPPPETPTTLVFLDPPYGTPLGAAALTACRAAGWIATDALISWEDDREAAPPEGFARLDARSFGQTTITWMETT